MSILSALFGNYGDDIIRGVANNADDLARTAVNSVDQIYPRVANDYFNIFTNQQFKIPYESAEDLAKVNALKNLIQSGDEIAPIAVRSAGNGQYAIDDGLHRMRAFYELGRQPNFRVFDNKVDSYNFADLWDKANKKPI